MPLTLYRFHNPDCKAKLLKKGLPVKAHREYTDCDCMIYMTGSTDNEIVPRQSTKMRDWKAAEALLRSMDASSKDVAIHGPTLEHCIREYTLSRTKIGGKALGQFKLALNRLKDYAATKNKMFIREITVELRDEFMVHGLDQSDNSKATTSAKITCFFKDAYRIGWVLEPIHLKFRPYTASYEPGLPFSEKEIPIILDGAESFAGGVSAYAKYPKTFRLLLELMLETGMRVGDAIRYNPMLPKRLKHLWEYSYTAQKSRRDKKPKIATVYLTDRMKDAIDKCEWMSKSRPFAYLTVDKDDSKDKTSYMANEVYERMKSIGAKHGIEDCRPHRLRDSFAVRLFLAGRTVDDVSKLLNHSSTKVTEDHYSPWVPERKERLEKILYETLNK